jgi:hypothetical protein
VTLNDIVDEAFFINLDRRSDRLLHVREEFAKNNVKAKRYAAVDGKNFDLYPNLSRGAAGCLESQRSIINLALENNYESIAIFEDDVFFVDNFEEKFNEFYSQVPDDWQFIFLANNKYNATVNRISPNVEQISGGWSAHAFIMRRRAMLAASEIISGGDMPVDVYYGILQQYYPSYSAVPSLAGQRADHSDIENIFIDYNGIYGL